MYVVVLVLKLDILPGDETRFESDIIEHASSYNFSVSDFSASSIAVSVCRNSVLMLSVVISMCDVLVQPSPET